MASPLPPESRVSEFRQPQSRLSSRGRPSSARLDDEIRRALRLLDDPIALEDLSLAHLPSVRVLAAKLYPGRTAADGLALRRLLLLVLKDIAADLEGGPLGALAQGLLAGRTQSDIAREIGMSEEYLCRRWKPALVKLVREAAVTFGQVTRLVPAA